MSRLLRSCGEIVEVNVYIQSMAIGGSYCYIGCNPYFIDECTNFRGNKDVVNLVRVSDVCGNLFLCTNKKDGIVRRF